MTFTRPEPQEISGVSFESDFDGRILMKVWPKDMASVDRTPEEFLLEPTEYLDMMRGLANAVESSVRRTVDHVKRGECERCGNYRLIDVPTHGGRTERVHCPDCGGPLGEDLYARPRLGGGVR